MPAVRALVNLTSPLSSHARLALLTTHWRSGSSGWGQDSPCASGRVPTDRSMMTSPPAATLTSSSTSPLPESTEQDEKPLRSKRRSEEHTSELQSRGHLVCRLLLDKNKQKLRSHSSPGDT